MQVCSLTILKIVHSGKLLQLQGLVEIHGKTLQLCRLRHTLLTSYMKKPLKKFHSS